MTTTETHPVGTADLLKRLRQRADEDRAIQKNNEAVAAALRGQRLLFDQGIRSNANNFAVRLGLDYENCAKKDAKLVRDWSDAADRIEQLVATVEQLEAAITRANAATAAAFEVAAEETPYESDRDAILALATPDQTAALDRLIAEAVENAAEIAAQFVHNRLYEANIPACSYHSRDIKAAILAASKKVSKP